MIIVILWIDHGKTTLMDKLLEHCGSKFSGERAMDSNDQEKERGITITSKYTRLYYNDHVLHVVDTPGKTLFITLFIQYVSNHSKINYYN